MILASDQNRFDFEHVEQNVPPADVLGGAGSGSRNWIHFLARSLLGFLINLPMSFYKQRALFICMLVLSCHQKTN